jgi:hypothetical protein
MASPRCGSFDERLPAGVVRRPAGSSTEPSMPLRIPLLNRLKLDSESYLHVLAIILLIAPLLAMYL